MCRSCPPTLEKGVIKPLPKSALPLVGWRLRDVSKPESRLLLTGMHTCANCHSFSHDGKTLGIDLDGPQNDKGLYAVLNIKPQMSIRNEDVISWNSFQSNRPVRIAGRVHVAGFAQRPIRESPRSMAATTSRISRTTVSFRCSIRRVESWRITTVPPGKNSRLPGADDPRYVQTGADWSPDGKYLVYARANAREPYPEGETSAEHANDPQETPDPIRSLPNSLQ